MLYHLLYPLSEHISVFNVFKYSTFRAIYASLTAITICFVISPFIIRKLKKLQLHQPIRVNGITSHKNKTNVPTIGGVIIIISIFVSTVLWAKLDNQFILCVLLSLFWFGGIGILDDYLKLKRQDSSGLSVKYKLLLQVIGAMFVVGFLYKVKYAPTFVTFTHIIIPFMKSPVNIAGFYIVLSMFVIVGSSNAVNLTDGLDGLAVGNVLFCAIALSVATYLAGHSKFSAYLGIINVKESSELVVFCSALVGSCIGFLWFNTYPAQIFMGDVGALSLGGVLGVLAVLIKQELLLILIGGIFVIEALSVIVQVASYKLFGKRVFKMAPLHHHFELLGVSEPKLVVRFWICSIIIALASLSLLKLR